MPVRKFLDDGGVPIQYLEVDGVLYPYVEGVDQETAIRAARQAKAYEDDIVLVTYPKSGTHWLWEVISMLVNGKAETIPKLKQYHMIEAISPETLASLPSPRVLNTHFRFSEISEDMKKKRTKLVLCHRNPKDIAPSFYNHHRKLEVIFKYKGVWNDWLPLYLEGKVEGNNWFDYVLDWEKAMNENPDYPIHLMFFEDMKEDSYREIKKLVKFLGLPCSDELCQAVADKCQFENMKRDKAGLESEFWRTVWENNKPEFYRKGQVGDWKNWFTVAQNEAFDKLYEERMAGSKLKFRFEL